eukprot:TRINITY_DN11190_c0_g1_i1.p1 TRINITY_DN11190_c0_g1~~TRINITY_DN11190_c0_g1_i1.p1  ORF type:complete len:726 (+),score=119.88 TRINITY_DN11190_c0_g1_i1:127-2304(+)
MVRLATLRLVCLSAGFVLAQGSVPGQCFGTGCEDENDAFQPAASPQQLLQVTSDRQPTGAVMNAPDMNTLQQLVAEGARPTAVEKMLSLLQSDQVASSDKPSAQHKAALDFNKTLEDTFVKNIRDDHDRAQNQMNNLTNILAQCTSTFKNAKGRADFLKQDKSSKKRQHEGCRATQVTLAADYKTARVNFFDKFLNVTKEPHSNRPASPNAAMDQYFKDLAGYWQQANKSYFDLKTKYDSAKATLESHEKNCTSQQASFELSYCAWHTSASDAIDDYQDCWSKANQTFYDTRNEVLKTGEHRQAEYNSVRRMQCMLAFFLDSAKRGGNATAQLKACKHHTANTSSLTLKNITPANMENVSSLGNLSLKPGDANWKTHEYSSIAVPSTLAKVLDCPSQKPRRTTMTSHLLFTSKGSASAYQNIWSGWYTKGNTVSSGDGKRGEYDALKLSTIKFSDSSGKFAEYTLSGNYMDKSLRDIVVGCGLTSSSKNDGKGKWKTGHCSIGTLKSSSGLSNLNSVLRLGVGDGTHDTKDWCVFMLKKGNGAGDFHGLRHHMDHGFSFGSEGHAAGSPNQVYIHGRGYSLQEARKVTTTSTTTRASQCSGRYAKVTFNNTANCIVAGEVEFYCDGTKRSASISHSTPHYRAYHAARSIDGKTDTYFAVCSHPKSAYIVYDLGSTCRLSKIRYDDRGGHQRSKTLDVAMGAAAGSTAHCASRTNAATNHWQVWNV